jgi:hypothetical protein
MARASLCTPRSLIHRGYHGAAIDNTGGVGIEIEDAAFIPGAGIGRGCGRVGIERVDTSGPTGGRVGWTSRATRVTGPKTSGAATARTIRS